MDMILRGEFLKAGEYYLKLIKNVYVDEHISILFSYLELFVREFYLLGKLDIKSMTSPNPVRNLPYLREFSSSYVPLIRTSTREAYPDESSPLGLISYENIGHYLVSQSCYGAVDSLISINSNLIVGKIIPILRYFSKER